METPTAIMIKLPEIFGAKEAKKLWREVSGKITSEEPCVVVDLSRVKQIDLAGVEGLLQCMEEIAKKDGAIQLRGISPEAATMLELTRMNALFQKFPAFPADAQTYVFPQEAPAEEVPAQAQVQPQPVAA
jgi:anti-anti-sigma regulatory factor